MNKAKIKAEIFGENVRLARKAARISTKVLADFIGISPAYVSLIERGDRYPSHAVAIKICDFFDADISEMLQARRETASQIAHDIELRRRQNTIYKMAKTFEDINQLDFIINVLKSYKKTIINDNSQEDV